MHSDGSDFEFDDDFESFNYENVHPNIGNLVGNKRTSTSSRCSLDSMQTFVYDTSK